MLQNPLQPTSGSESRSLFTENNLLKHRDLGGAKYVLRRGLGLSFYARPWIIHHGPSIYYGRSDQQQIIMGFLLLLWKESSLHGCEKNIPEYMHLLVEFGT